MSFKKFTSLSLVFLASASFHSSQAQGAGGNLCAGADDAALCRSVVVRAKTPYAAMEKIVNRLICEAKQAKTSAARPPPEDSPIFKETLKTICVSSLCLVVGSASIFFISNNQRLIFC
ncbi:hypothetical protein ACFX15_020714 [Malus domestica]